MITEAQAKADGLKLVERSKVASLATIGKDGFPEIRAMLKTGKRRPEDRMVQHEHLIPKSRADTE